MLIFRMSNCISTASGIVTTGYERTLAICGLNSHLKRVMIPDAVLIQFDILKMSIIVLETYTGI